MLGADDVKSTQLDHLVMLFLPVGAGGVAATQNDVGAAASHVSGHGYGVQFARLGDDGGFVLVVLGVQHLVRYAPLL